MNERYDIGTVLKYVIVVIIIVSLFYGLTVFLTNKKSTSTDAETSKSNDKAVIQYSEIIIGEMFDQNQSEYYVLLENKDDNNIASYENLIKTYRGKENHLSFYTVNLNSAFNKKYISNKNNLEKDNFKIKDTALIKIKNGDIVETYQEHNTINQQLQEISE